MVTVGKRSGYARLTTIRVTSKKIHSSTEEAPPGIGFREELVVHSLAPQSPKKFINLIPTHGKFHNVAIPVI